MRQVEDEGQVLKYLGNCPTKLFTGLVLAGLVVHVCARGSRYFSFLFYFYNSNFYFFLQCKRCKVFIILVQGSFGILLVLFFLSWGV